MKKLLALMLVVVMSLSLVACGGDTTEETSGTNNQTTNETAEHNSDTSNEEEQVNLVGTWKGFINQSVKLTMVINEDGTGTLTEGEGESQNIREFNWEVKNEMFITNFLDGGMLEFAVNTVDGAIELNFDNIYVLTLE